MVRIFSEQNIIKFKNNLRNSGWEFIYNGEDINEGYNYFERKIKEIYQTSLKLVRLSRKRAKDKNR